MNNDITGNMDGSNLKLGIVVSRFNNMVTEKLLSGAKDKLERLGVNLEQVDVAYVPGAFELPRGVKQMEKKGSYEGIVALGAVIRGETPHFDYVANETSKGLAKLNLESEVPVTFGIITADTLDQAINRAGGKQGNKGDEASEALIEMINLEKTLSEEI